MNEYPLMNNLIESGHNPFAVRREGLFYDWNMDH